MDELNQYGKTKLIKACIQSDEYMVNELIKYGANLDIQDNSGFTALMISTLSYRPIYKNAFYPLNEVIIRELIFNGCATHLTNNYGHTFKDMLIEHDRTDVLTNIIDDYKKCINLEIDTKGTIINKSFKNGLGERNVVVIIVNYLIQ